MSEGFRKSQLILRKVSRWPIDIDFDYQEFSFCSPEKENCVKRQPLRDNNCLVPCTGLYADVADDYEKDTVALGRNTIKGDHCFKFNDVHFMA